MNDEERHKEAQEEDRSEGGIKTDQEVEGSLPQIEEEMESEREQDNTDANESDEEEDNRDDDPVAPREEGAHSSGYNLRKRKEVNYREARKYNTTATVLYQYGEASKS